MNFPLFFTRHVTESIAINQERRPFYREMSQGQSERAFRLLLTLEYLMIPSAYYFDLRALPFQKKGIPLLRDELVSMNRTPQFDPARRVPVTRGMPELPWRKYYRDLKTAGQTKDPGRVVQVTTRIIEEMSDFPEYYPMTRHLIESVHRFAWFLPAREDDCLKRGVKSPRQLVFQIIDYHLLGLWYFVLIDRAGERVHREGIPMLTCELPDLLSDLRGNCLPFVD